MAYQDADLPDEVKYMILELKREVRDRIIWNLTARP